MSVIGAGVVLLIAGAVVLVVTTADTIGWVLALIGAGLILYALLARRV